MGEAESEHRAVFSSEGTVQGLPRGTKVTLGQNPWFGWLLPVSAPTWRKTTSPRVCQHLILHVQNMNLLRVEADSSLGLLGSWKRLSFLLPSLPPLQPTGSGTTLLDSTYWSSYSGSGRKATVSFPSTCHLLLGVWSIRRTISHLQTCKVGLSAWSRAVNSNTVELLKNTHAQAAHSGSWVM